MLHRLVLALGDEGGVDGEDVPEQVTEPVDPFIDLGCVVSDVPKVLLHRSSGTPYLVNPPAKAARMPVRGRAERWNWMTSRDGS